MHKMIYEDTDEALKYVSIEFLTMLRTKSQDTNAWGDLIADMASLEACLALAFCVSCLVAPDQ